MEERAQTGVEFLLIIVAIVVIATVVGVYIKSIANAVTQSGQAEANK